MVARGGQDDDLDAADPGNGHIERASAQVVDEHGLIGHAGTFQAIGQGRGGRLIDDPHHLEPGRGAGLDRRLALGVAEIRRHGDHGPINGLTECILGVRFQPRQYHRREICRRICLSMELKLKKGRAHVRFEEAGDFRVAQSGQFLGLLSDRRRVGAEVDDRGHDVLPVPVGDHLRPAQAIAVRHDGVGGAQVDADVGGHESRLLEHHGPEASLRKMPVGRHGIVESVLSHDGEGDAIRESPLLVRGRSVKFEARASRAVSTGVMVRLATSPLA